MTTSTYTWRTHWRQALAVLALLMACGLEDVRW
jgi:hypothetical protein